MKAKILLSIIFITLELTVTMHGMEPAPASNTYQQCIECHTYEWWSSLLKIACGHCYCGKCSFKIIKENGGKCITCWAPFFNFSNLPDSLHFQILRGGKKQPVDDVSDSSNFYRANAERGPKSLFNAYTRQAAEALVSDGASVHERSWQYGNGLLELVMTRKEYAPDLVTFYRQQGLSVDMRPGTTPPEHGLSPLQRICNHPDKASPQLFAKVNALLEGLKPKKIVALLDQKCNDYIYNYSTVFELVENEYDIQAPVLYCYLQKLKKEALERL